MRQICREIWDGVTIIGSDAYLCAHLLSLAVSAAQPDQVLRQKNTDRQLGKFKIGHSRVTIIGLDASPGSSSCVLSLLSLAVSAAQPDQVLRPNKHRS